MGHYVVVIRLLALQEDNIPELQQRVGERDVTAEVAHFAEQRQPLGGRRRADHGVLLLQRRQVRCQGVEHSVLIELGQQRGDPAQQDIHPVAVGGAGH